MKSSSIGVYLLLTGFYSFSQSNCTPPKGYIPDADTAKKIAESVWLLFYGKSALDEKPYKAILNGDSVWLVSGILHFE